MTNFLDLPKLPPIIYGKEEYPLFTRISIETTKTCTRDCWFCPSSERGPKVQTMTDALYNKILDELNTLQFDGVVQWFYLNEPLLDKGHVQRIEQLRKACPRCCIHMTTNWDLMWKKDESAQISKIADLFDAGVNSLNLNDYDHRGYMKVAKKASIQIDEVEFGDHNWKKLAPSKRFLSCGPLPEKLHSWSGYVTEEDIAEDGLQSQGAKGCCPRPMRHIVVQYNGVVPLCCAVNPLVSEEFGDINKQSLVDVWNCKRLYYYRSLLQEGRREGDCQNCDARVAYAHVVRKVKLK